MSLNLSELQQVLPNPGQAGPSPSPGSYYPIDDKMFGLTEKQKELRQSAFNYAQKELAFVENGDDETVDDKQTTIERQLFQNLGKLGLLGVRVTEDYGGIGGCHLDEVIIHEELTQASFRKALLYNSETNFCIYPIYHYGTEEQKRKYLPKLCSGEHIGLVSYSIMYPDSVELRADKQADCYILNGVGLVVTTNIDILIIYATTNRNIDYGITAFIVETSFEGCSFEGCNSFQFKFHNCKVPAVNMLGKKNEGNRLLISCSNVDSLNLTGGFIGCMQTFCNIIFKYIYSRQGFLELKDQVADVYTKLSASRNYVYTVARNYENNLLNSKNIQAAILYCKKKAKKLALYAKEIVDKTDCIDPQIKRLLDDMDFYFETIGNEKEADIISQLISFEYSSSNF